MEAYAHLRRMDIPAHRRGNGGDADIPALNAGGADSARADSGPAAAADVSGFGELFCDVLVCPAAGGGDYPPYWAVWLGDDGRAAHPSPGVGDFAAAGDRPSDAGGLWHRPYAGIDFC